MTILLQWWMLPVVIFLFGLGFMLHDFRNAHGFLAGFSGMLTFWACTIAAVFLTIGHFL